MSIVNRNAAVAFAEPSFVVAMSKEPCKPKSSCFLTLSANPAAPKLNVHFHGIFLDGGYETDNKSFVFHDLSNLLTSEDVAWAIKKIALRSIQILKRQGFLEKEGLVQGDETDAMELCDEASIKNMIAFGERAGKPVRRIRLAMDEGNEATIKGHLVAEMHGFNLKADRKVKQHQRWKLARLVRYIARPLVAMERLKFRPGGKLIQYSMKRPWSDGTTEVLLSGVELIEKLAAAIPPPRGHLVRYIGVLAPNSSMRRSVVPKPKPKARDLSGNLLLSATQRIAWAKLIQKTFGTDLNVCEVCGGCCHPRKAEKG